LEAADRELEQLKAQQEKHMGSAQAVAVQLRKSHSRCFMSPFADDRDTLAPVSPGADKGRRRFYENY
jgi:hypothetical protein